MPKKTAVILFNLGGPDSPKAVRPFLLNLFSDKAIIPFPYPIRKALAIIISSTRYKQSKKNYIEIGGKTPLLENTKKQAESLEKKLGKGFKTFIAMRYWNPRTKEIIKQVKLYNPDEIILLPLYPQFSTTTTASSIKEWITYCKKNNLNKKTKTICCYYNDDYFIKAHVINLEKTLIGAKNPKILFSAHGLPKSVIEKGDPYQYQIEQTAKEIIKRLNKNIEYKICYQSKVGVKKWLEPSAEKEIKDTINENKTAIICPISFVSEHVETIHELDIEYKNKIKKEKQHLFKRVPALQIEENFIQSLANLCKEDTNNECSQQFCKCYKNG